MEGRYATALYSAAMKSGGDSTLLSLEKDLKVISTYVMKTPSAQRFLEDPTMSRKDKKSAVASFVSKVALSEKSDSSSGGNLLSNFMQVLAENGRLAMMPRVISAFEDLLKAHRHQIDIQLISASPLPTDYLKLVSDKIIKQFIPASVVPLINNQVNFSFSLHILFTLPRWILLSWEDWSFILPIER